MIAPVVQAAPTEPSIVVPETPPEPQNEPVAALSTPTQLSDRIAHYATLYGVSAATMEAVVECESSGNPRALGDQGKSRGLVQIHADYHPTVTDEMAYDPDYALDFLARHLADGKGSLWTCYRQLRHTADSSERGD